MYILLKVEDYFCVKNCIFPVDSRKQIPNTLWLVKLNERAKSLERVGKNSKAGLKSINARSTVKNVFTCNRD